MDISDEFGRALNESLNARQVKASTILDLFDEFVSYSIKSIPRTAEDFTLASDFHEIDLSHCTFEKTNSYMPLCNVYICNWQGKYSELKILVGLGGTLGVNVQSIGGYEGNPIPSFDVDPYEPSDAVVKVITNIRDCSNNLNFCRLMEIGLKSLEKFAPNIPKSSSHPETP